MLRVRRSARHTCSHSWSWKETLIRIQGFTARFWFRFISISTQLFEFRIMTVIELKLQGNLPPKTVRRCPESFLLRLIARRDSLRSGIGGPQSKSDRTRWEFDLTPTQWGSWGLSRENFGREKLRRRKNTCVSSQAGESVCNRACTAGLIHFTSFASFSKMQKRFLHRRCKCITHTRSCK